MQQSLEVLKEEADTKVGAAIKAHKDNSFDLAAYQQKCDVLATRAQRIIDGTTTVL